MGLLPSIPKKPTRPGEDKKPESRAKHLAKARETYRYSYDYPEGVAMAHEVPKNDMFSPAYLAQVAELDLTIVANHGVSRIAHFMGDEEEHEGFFHRVRDKITSLAPHDLKDHITSVAHQAASLLVGRRASCLDDYAGFYGAIAETPIVGAYGNPLESDEAFAWSRIAGPNPKSLRAIDALPANFPVDEARFARALPGGSDSLAAALAEGRAFLTDYVDLDGAPQGTTGGYQKHLWAPLALFVSPRGADKSVGALVPVAIQREQRPSADNPIVSPDEGMAWTIAKTVVSIADGNLHQAITHLAETHLVMEAVILAAKRNLAPNHPLLILLEPHFEFTLALNEVARTNLVAPDGQVDHVLGATLEGSLAVVKKGLERFRFDERAPRKELASRGAASLETLPQYPYRDDALIVWDALEGFVRDYIGLYYTDADVASDPELKAFAAEIGASDGGRIAGVPTLDSVDALVELITLAIFTASAQHAAVNFPQFPFMGYLPSMPGAGYAPLPPVGSDEQEAGFLAMLPPLDQALKQFDVTYQLSNLRDSKLGDYSLLHFRDSRVHGLVTAFKSALTDIEAQIREREASRLLPYPYLMPSLIPGSIHI